MNESRKLKRSLSLFMLTFYGLGTIIGAGIYVLVGKVAGEAGQFAPASFLIAALLASFTAFSYAELVARYPNSAGEAVYVQQAFNWRPLAQLIGFLIVLVGIVSTATLANGFVGYLDRFIELPAWITITLLIVGLGALAAWGIDQSVGVAVLLTVVEILGLIIVLWSARGVVVDLPMQLENFWPGADMFVWHGVLLGAFVAFYAFVGFEDMVNVAEEVQDPSRTVPLAIIMALLITTSLYVLVAMTAVAGLPLEMLAGSEAPLADMYRHFTGQPATIIIIIGLLSVLNGILVQIIMATRVLYGMGAKVWIPDWFAQIQAQTRTPLNATIVVVIITLVMAISFPVLTLAKATSFITLIIFTLMNLSLWRVKVIDKFYTGFSVPLLVPVIGTFASGGFVSYQFLRAML